MDKVRVYMHGDIEIYCSDDPELRKMNKLSVNDIREFIDTAHPDIAKRIRSVTLNPFRDGTIVKSDSYFTVAACIRHSPNPVFFGEQPKTNSEVLDICRESHVIEHEVGHSIDGEFVRKWKKNKNWAESTQWMDAMQKDMAKSGSPWVTRYAESTMLTAEDFAESVAQHCKDPVQFAKDYPARAKLVKQAMDGPQQ